MPSIVVSVVIGTTGAKENEKGARIALDSSGFLMKRQYLVNTRCNNPRQSDMSSCWQ